MHVIFVSMCEKRAIKRTRSVLDAYANRIGDSTWSTPITTEALQTIKLALKQKATRQSAIACYRNQGMRRMTLLWTVGSSSMFGKSGEIAIGTRGHKSVAPPHQWLSNACLVAKESGLGHDIGKTSANFQEKLARAIQKESGDFTDPARHEIISALILSRLLAGQSWGEAWTDLRIENKTKDLVFMREGINSYQHAILYCIATHHKLFGGESGRALGLDNHLNLINGAEYVIVKIAPHRDSDKVKSIAENMVRRITAKVSTEDNRNEAYWRGIAIIARAGLILADHKVSAEAMFEQDNQQCFANTNKRETKGSLLLNQGLSWHLSHVGREAGLMVRNMASLSAPGVSDETINELTMRASGRFEWQNTAAMALTAGRPSLVFNIAATGSGKTRMNARAAAVLTGDRPLRLSVVLNLRSLTLQTGDVYRHELHTQPDELAVQIGDSSARKMHEYERADINECELTTTEEQEDPEIESQPFDTPEWLSSSCKTANTKAIAMSPILVATIDYIINAGDPRKQAKHAIALLRIMHSDIIIDEIDSYESEALAAVMRLVQLAGMFGRNVIVSSATLSNGPAALICRSYASGFETFKSMNNSKIEFQSVIIDDSIAPSVADGAVGFDSMYQQHVSAMMLSIKKNIVTKKAEIVRFEKNSKAMRAAILSTIHTMHVQHQWGVDSKLSIGLIRVANIGRAIELANEISKLSDTQVCCYHAQHFSIQRYYIEQRLDQLLTRKGSQSNQAIMKDAEISALINQSHGRDVKIIVIATPVEEVGRDHDFDWAIIEPSSAQSIVQTAGRVNRHRLAEVVDANIGILQYNYRAIEKFNGSKLKNDGDGLVFIKPGYEQGMDRGNTTHKSRDIGLSHDMCDLLNETLLLERLDADLRFNDVAHKFSSCDNKSISTTLKKLAVPVIESTEQWMGKDIYEKTPLRSKSTKTDWHFDGENWYVHEYHLGQGVIPKRMNGVISLNEMKGLFVLPINQLLTLAEDIGLSMEQAFKLSLYRKDADNCTDNYIVDQFGCAKTTR